MRILYLLTGLGIGGAENIVIDQCQALISENQLTVAYLRDIRDHEKKLNDMGVKTVLLDFKKTGVFPVIRKIIRIVKENKIDLISTHLPAADTLGRLAGLFTKAIIVSTIHGCDGWKMMNRPACIALRLYNRFTVNCFKRVKLIAVSDTVQDFCVRYEKIKPEKIHVIGNIIDVKNSQKTDDSFVFPYPKDRFIMLTVARLAHEKGYPVLLEAIKELVQVHGITNLMALILGDGDIKEEIKKYINENNLNEYIEMPGFQKNVYDYMRNADVFVFPSRNEGQGIVTLEAFYNRIYVIASDIPASADVLKNGTYGTLFRDGDSRDLANKVADFIHGKVHAEEKIKLAYDNFCLNNDMDHYIGKLYNVFKG